MNESTKESERRVSDSCDGRRELVNKKGGGSSQYGGGKEGKEEGREVIEGEGRERAG